MPLLFNHTNNTISSTSGTVNISGLTGSSIPAQDDGVEIVASPTALNFVGAGVVVTDVSGVATITIAGGGGGGAVDSVNTQTGVVVLDADDISDAATTNKFTTAADISKLAGIEAAATADQTGAEIKAAYEAEANTNAFTDANQSKLSGIAAAATVGVATQDEGGSIDTDATTLNFVGAGVTATDAGFGVTTITIAGGGAVDSVNSQTGVVVLDADDISDAATTNKFTTSTDISKLAGIEALATADQTGAEIKTAYEGEADTNAFTDAEQTKLAGVATGATVGVTTQDEGILVDADATTLNFVGAGVTATDAGAGVTTVTIAGGGSALEVEDEGVSLSTAVTKFNFAGTGVTVTEPIADEMLVTIPGGIDGADGADGAVGFISRNAMNGDTTASGSAFASKGNILIPQTTFSLEAVEFTISSTATQTVDICVARLTSETGTIAEILHDVGTLAVVDPPSNTVFTFPTPLTLIKDTVYAIFFVRTDGIGTSALAVSFPGSDEVTQDPQNYWRSVTNGDTIRYTSNAPAVSDSPVDTTTTGSVGMIPYASLEFRTVPDGGTAGQLLSKIDSVDYNTEWVDTPNFIGFRAARTGSNQAISATTDTTILYNDEIFDTETAYDPVTGIFTVPASLDGKYMSFSAALQFDGNENAVIKIRKGAGPTNTIANTETNTCSHISTTSGAYLVSTGDTIFVQIFTDLATNVTNNANCYFAGHVIGS